MSGNDGPLTIRPCTSDDMSELLRLHNRGFGPDRSEAHWRWRFEQNPLGWHATVGAFTADGRCVGAYAGVPLRFAFGSEPAIAINAGDIATDPDLRRTMRGSLVLLRMSRSFYDRFGGGDVRMVYGFPEPPLLRLSVQRQRVQVLWDVAVLVRASEQPLDPPPGLELRRVDRWSADVDDLWRRCSAEIPTGIVRDRAYVNWRFADHPTIDYTCLEVRGRDRELRGIAALRAGGWHPDVLSLCDWLVPLDDADACRALLAEAVSAACAAEKPAVVAWFSPRRPEFHRLQVEFGFHVRHSHHQQTFRSFHPGVTRTALADDLYQTMADIDFY